MVASCVGGSLWETFMVGLIVPRLVTAPPPELIESASRTPDQYCDLAIVKPFGEMVRVYLCQAATPDGLQAKITGVVVLPYSGWLLSHGWAREALLWMQDGLH